MQLSVFFVLVIFLSPLVQGCCSQRLAATSTTDSIRVEVVERVEVIRDTVEVEITEQRDSIVTLDTISYLSNDYAESRAQVNGRELIHTLKSKPQIIYTPYEVEVVVRDTITEKSKVETKIVEVERDFTKWESFQMSAFRVLAAAIALCGLVVVLLKRLG